MKSFKNIFETVYEPRSGDEKNFKDKHVVAKYKYPVPTESQFTSNSPKAKRKADYDKGDDEAVYEDIRGIHTKRADKQAVIVRTIDPITRQSKTIVKKGPTGEIKIGEAVEVDEKVVNPYAVGMAAAMKATGDRPPLKKSTIIKGHEIAKGIKNEAMDPVGKEDEDIDNDGDVDKSDKYLHARRKAISKALRKEEWYTDNAGKEYPFSKPFSEKSKAHEFAKNNELGKSAVKSRPAGYVVEKPSMKEEFDLDEDVSTGENEAEIRNTSYTNYTKSNKPTRIKKNAEDVVAEDAKDLSHANHEKYKSGSKGPTKTQSLKDDLGEERARTSAYIGTVKTDDPDYQKKVAELKSKAPAGGTRVRGRAPTPEFKHLYKRGGALHRYSSQDIKPEHSSRVDVYAKSGTYKEDLDEAFKVGSMKLKDGSSVTLTRESVDALNDLFGKLNAANKSKMEERLMSSPGGYKEILSFAENI